MSQHQLSQSLRGRHLTMISIGGIIGAGLFVGSGSTIQAAGPASFISYAICGLLILMVMRMLAEMAMALPEVRSFTEFARAGLGHGAGFVIGWLYWYFWVLVVPVEAIAGANIIHDWLPGVGRLPIGLTLMAAMTAVNLMSARSYAEFEFWFASIKVAAILVFILLAALFAFGITSPHSTFGNLTEHGGFTPNTWLAVIAAVPSVFFAMTGAEITTIAAAESSQPAKAVARMSSTVIWRILGFYVTSLFLIVCVVPWTSVHPPYSPYTLALDTMQIPYASKLISAVILTAVLSCLNSAFYVSSRVMFILAERGDAPQGLVKLNRRKVPVVSVLMGAVAGFIGIIMASEEAAQSVFNFLVSSSGAIAVFVYMAIAFAQIRLRHKREAEGKPQPAILMWLFPYLSYVVIAGMTAVLIAMAYTKSMQRDLIFSFLALAVAWLAYLAKNSLKPRTVSNTA